MKPKTAPRKTPIIPALLIAIGLLTAAGQPAEDPAARLQEKLRALRSLQADFEQWYYSGTVAKPLHEKGRLFLQKPDLMRWEYTEPEAKVFLYKDEVFSQYYPEDGQLIRSSLAKAQYESEVLTLLSGQKNLDQDYEIKPDLSTPEARAVGRLTLVPRVEGEYSAISLDVDSRTGLIRRADFQDSAGNHTVFNFNKIKENPALKAAVFVLDIPPDTEIIDEAAPPLPVRKKGPPRLLSRAPGLEAGSGRN